MGQREKVKSRVGRDCAMVMEVEGGRQQRKNTRAKTGCHLPNSSAPKQCFPTLQVSSGCGDDRTCPQRAGSSPVAIQHQSAVLLMSCEDFFKIKESVLIELWFSRFIN